MGSTNACKIHIEKPIMAIEKKLQMHNYVGITNEPQREIAANAKVETGGWKKVSCSRRTVDSRCSINWYRN